VDIKRRKVVWWHDKGGGGGLKREVKYENIMKTIDQEQSFGDRRK